MHHMGVVAERRRRRRAQPALALLLPRLVCSRNRADVAGKRAAEGP